MTRIIFVRHGETEWNLTGRFQGISDIPLSETGRRQAALLGRRFASGELRADRLYASPLSRAVETAGPIAAATGLSVETDPRFMEVCYGEWDGRTFSQLREAYGEPFLQFMKEPHKYSFPGEGSFEKVQQRVHAGLADMLCPENLGKDLVLVGHSCILRIAVFDLLGMDLSLFNQFWIDNTGICVVEQWDNGRRVLRTMNDHSHLAEV